MRKIANYFFQGLIFLVPIGITLYVFYSAFHLIDGWFGLGVPGLGFALTLVIITLFGVLASHVFTRSLLGLIERLMDRLPFVRLFHSALRDLLSAVVGEKRRFDKPVLVRLLPGSSAMVIGFITQDSLEPLGIKGHVAVYLPQSYNFAGQLVIVAEDLITPLELASSSAMTLILSAGVAGPRNQAGAAKAAARVSATRPS